MPAQLPALSQFCSPAYPPASAGPDLLPHDSDCYALLVARTGSSAPPGSDPIRISNPRNPRGLGAATKGPFCVLRRDAQGLEVRIPSHIVSESYSSMTGSKPLSPIQFPQSVDPGSSGGGAIIRLAQFLLSEAEQGATPLLDPIIAKRFAEVLALSIVAHLEHDHSGQLRGITMAGVPRYVRRAEEFLSTNITRPVTMRELAIVAGVTPRALQYAFESTGAVHPMEFLRAKRFSLARDRLMASDKDSISQIATELRLGHLGRFSCEYKRRFGESPSETRLNAQRRSAPSCARAGSRSSRVAVEVGGGSAREPSSQPPAAI